MPLVTIETRRGLSAETKRRMFDAVHAALMAAFKIPDEDRAQRLIEEIPIENWGFRGIAAACDIDLGFKVAV